MQEEAAFVARATDLVVSAVDEGSFQRLGPEAVAQIRER